RTGRSNAYDFAVSLDDASDGGPGRGVAACLPRPRGRPTPVRVVAPRPPPSPSGALGGGGRPRAPLRDPRDRDPAARARARPPRHRRGHPPPSRTLPVGPGIAPGRRPAGCEAFAGFHRRSGLAPNPEGIQLSVTCSAYRPTDGIATCSIFAPAGAPSGI